ncbi:MAG: ABC transporter permease [Paracoccaceae bacterium]|nr:ABC transporter permease [Paracoccaceae bacterium]
MTVVETDLGGYQKTVVDRLAPYAKYLLLSPMILLMLGFFVIPLLWLLRISFYESRGASGFGIGGAAGQEGGGFYVEGTWTLDNYVRFFTDDYFMSVMMFTIGFALLVTLVTMILAYPMAYYIYRAPPKLKTALILIVILPKLSNMLVLVYGLQMLLANNGLVNELIMLVGVSDEPIKLVYTLFSATVSKVLLVIPYTILVITATLHTLDPSLREASRGLGASPFKTFWLVTFPLSVPGTLIALLITIVWALGAFVSPSLLGNPETQTLRSRFRSRRSRT